MGIKITVQIINNIHLNKSLGEGDEKVASSISIPIFICVSIGQKI